MKWARVLAISLGLALVACGQSSDHAGAQRPLKPYTLPKNVTSIYPLGTPLTDQNGEKANLDVFAGHPVIVSMFYGSCPAACPMMVRDIQRTEQRLAPETRADLRVLLVSFDPERDTPAALRAMAAAHGVDQARWRLTQTSADGARTLAAVLGIQYRRLGTGEYAHSVVISVLDRKGAVVAHVEGLGQPSDEIVGALEAVEAIPSG